MRIEPDDLLRPEVRALLREHLTNMHELSPPESVHALDISGLQSPDVAFWTVWEGSLLMGCGALKELDATHGEVKSMRTPAKQRRRGAGRAVLTHIVAEAKARGYHRLSLETGSLERSSRRRSCMRASGSCTADPSDRTRWIRTARSCRLS